MMDSRTILMHMAKRFYEDVKFVTNLNPVNIVDEETTAAFNNLLSDSKMAYPANPTLKSFNTLSPRNLKYKDCVVVAGQLAAFLELMSNRADSFQTAMQQAAAPDPAANDSFDSELYSDLSPSPDRNEDGTIPFRLD